MGPVQGELVLANWQGLLAILKKQSQVELTGNLLTIPSLIAVSRYSAVASIDKLPEDVVRKIDGGVKFLHEQLERGHSIYGVTTGFGGSANTSTSDTTTLQKALLQMQISAVLPAPDATDGSSTFPYQGNWSSNESLHKLAMPEAWVRGAILIRCNSLLRGHSGVRLEVIRELLKLLEHNLIPLVPLRGSISASGDLCPLSYVAGVLEGNPDVKVWTGDRGSRRLVFADKALKDLGMHPVSFGPKEILGLLNGTAFSAAVASIAQHEVDTLVVLAQILTAMGVEALMGTIESFDPFIGQVRPHRGQIEVASNMRSFLKGSHFVRTGVGKQTLAGDLRQDRYAIRTSAQWIGPCIEDIALAREQLEVELNSTTDNPMIDLEKREVRHGGNFQAAAITSSTEKTRLAIERIGKMIFAQSSELLDVRLNDNLPPNLAVDEPSLSYSMKGIDINMAAYMSELSLLANPVGNHVQYAEMGNQAINSLALISARYTHMAIDVISLMLSAYLYTLCHALDIRAMNERLVHQLRPAIMQITARIFRGVLKETNIADLENRICLSMLNSLSTTSSIDSTKRFVAIAQATQHHFIEALQHVEFDTDSPLDGIKSASLITRWAQEAAATANSIFCANRERYLANPDASKYLGSASKRMYTFVRDELKVPMHRGLIDHPTSETDNIEVPKKNTGSQISIIYNALREEKLNGPIMQCLKEAIEEGQRAPAAKL